MPQVTPCPTIDDLQRFALGRSGGADAERLQEHLAGCPSCLETLHRLETKDTVVEAQRGEAHPPPSSADTTTDSNPAHRLRQADDCSFLGTPESPDELGRLGGYRVLQVLGAGGMGIVFEAFDPRLKRRVALKVMKPALAASELARRRFHREAQSIAALEHDHIVAVHKVGEDRGVPFLAMPLLHGESLEVRLRREESGVRGQKSEVGTQSSDIAEALRIGREIAEGLAAAHAAGITHRDIKPANVWLEKAQGRPSLGFGRVKLLDFGLARPEKDDAHLTQAGVVAGTPSYMPPEQAEGKGVDPRSDLFSLGAVLYRMTTGRLPFPGTNAIAVLRALAVVEPEPPRKLNPDVPADLSTLITRLLAKKPADRPQSAREVVESLARIERDLAKPAVARRPSRRRRVAVLAIVAGTALVAAAAGIAWYYRPGEPGPASVDPLRPFVVQARDGYEEAKFATLQEALDESVDDDVIEVRGDGPYAIPMVSARSKALTIRAGGGFQPVFHPEKSDDPSMLYGTGALTLEGLEFRAVARTPHAKPHEWPLRVDYTSLRMANCRFVFSQPPGTHVFQCNAPWLEVRNCQFLCGAASHPGDWAPRPSGRLILENNIIAGDRGGPQNDKYRGPVVGFYDPAQRRASIQLKHNTLVGRQLLLVLKPGPASEKLTEKPIDVDAAHNVWNAAKGVVYIHPATSASPPLPTTEALGLVRSLVAWRDQRNVLPESLDFLGIHGPQGGVQAANNLKEWATFWGHDQPGDIQGPVRFGAADLHARLNAQDESLQPEDFRLAPDSAGRGAGEGGRDLGADVDLVGPGPAYERWKKTPGYQSWLAMTEQRLEPAPFVVLGSGANPEAKFPTLAAAVDAARTGDVIEIHGKGPFVSPPIKIAGKPLTIRAAPGCRPVVQLSPDATRFTPLLQSNARLTIEGLELHRSSPLRDVQAQGLHPLIVANMAPLFVAHCRFVMPGPAPATALVGKKAPLIDVRHCQFGGGPRSRGVRWGSPEEGRLVVENCLFAAMDTAVAYAYAVPSVRRLSLRFVNNTVTGGTPLWFSANGTRDDVLAVNARGRKPIEDMPIQVDMTDNFLDADCCAAGGLTLNQTITPEQYKKLLHCLVDMREERNLLRAGLKFLDTQLNNQPIHLAHSLAEWQQWQSRPESGSQEVEVRYRFGDPVAKARLRPERIHPMDFSASPDTPGLKLERTGFNIGCRPMKVGPGAYDRWRATPEYEVWLKAISAVAAGPVAGPGPFVVLGDEANTYANLEAAVNAAADGDVIEIRGDGPFAMPPLLSFAKSMTIRAAPGFTPVLDFEPAEPAAPNSSLLYSNNGALTLEGLTLRRVSDKPGHLVKCQRGPCRILNCRFERGGAFIEYAPQAEVRNCLFVTPSGWPFVGLKRWSGDAVVENNIAVGASMGVMLEVTEANLPGGAAPKTTVRIARNTFALPMEVVLCSPHKPTPKDTPVPMIRLDVSDNIFDCDKLGMVFSQMQATYTKDAPEHLGADAESLLRQMFDWQGRRNLYPKGIDLFYFHSPKRELPQPDCRDLSAWQRIWGAKETDSSQDRPRYQGGDMRGRPLVIPSPLQAQDFKLAAGSPGAGKGEGGRDLGADTTFVGPGAAYERYRATPEYQEWLKTGRQQP